MPQKAVWMPVLRTAMFYGWDRIKLKKNPIQQLFQVVAWGGNTVTEFFPLSMQKERALTWPVQAAGCRDHELGSQQSKTPLWSVNIWCLWVCIYRKQLTCWFCTLVAFFFPAANLTLVASMDKTFSRCLSQLAFHLKIHENITSYTNHETTGFYDHQPFRYSSLLCSTI